MYYCSTSSRAVPVRFREAENIHYVYYLHTQKNTHTFLVTAPLSDAALYIYLTTQKAPITFRHGRCIVVDNINYFSSLIACVMYALFASFAAFFASRLTFR